MLFDIINFLIDNELAFRVGCFVSVFILLMTWEHIASKRPLMYSKNKRWRQNISLLAVDVICLRFLLPVGAMGMAIITKEYQWGLFNFFSPSLFVQVFLSIIIFDFVIYLQHIIFHSIPVLWRVHAVHHLDQDIDVTTAIRFHPVEIILSMLLKFAVICALGPPIIAVLLFEVFLNGFALFNHSNIRLPFGADSLLRMIIVTPDMHRVHHSVKRSEYMTNYGVVLSWWDRLFKTYTEQPDKGHTAMEIGLINYRDDNNSVVTLLAMPFHEASNDESHKE